MDNFKKRLKTFLGELKEEFNGIRTNRPSPALVEGIKVDYYGKKVPLKHVASINISPPRDIIVQVWDKESIQTILKSIEIASPGLSAVREKETIRLRLPELSEERRGEFIKYAKKVAEQNRIKIRNARDDEVKEIQKQHEEKKISEDDKFRLKEELQEEVNEANREIEKTLERKIEEIRE